jgi:hypothetical protein
MTHPPFPVIVGVSRSGTTLLRLMLDAHPELAIPPETHWAAAFAPLAGQPLTPERAAELLTTSLRWPDFGMTADDLLPELRQVPHLDISEALRGFYRVYARRHGKRRSGDKTPNYGQVMAAVETLLPEARFVHIIRDGRDVVVSWRATAFASSREVAVLAASWRDRILTTRRQARSCRHYLEIRYETLIAAPRETLETVCRFIELPFDPAMLAYHRSAQQRLAELGDSYRSDGAILNPRASRLEQHRLTAEPPRADRIGRWRTELAPHEREAFMSAAGDLLTELGYDGDAPEPAAAQASTSRRPRPRRRSSLQGATVSDHGGGNA